MRNSMEDNETELEGNETKEYINAEQIEAILETFVNNKKVLGEPTFTVIIIVYSILVTIAVIGNVIVMLTFLKRKHLWTTRNIFIFNLAISDFLMACSIPFTVMDGLTRFWFFPHSLLACR